ncbi:hypothetical protein F0562_017491 [Nyssa sinensis]|uniref:Rx N-terminal domain-containing protein n=1 Tax=Nyssa sinensis TaxID=561372 RepID=A0A5J4ZJ17_9ASTE|nr:hypothetical protein F0562_017491 [Nyssa sinensis]
MAETFLFSIIGTVLGKLSYLPFQEIGLAWGVKSDLKKLENTLSTIRAVLLDAEKQQEKNHEVRDWLQKLEDVLYDIDDVLDDFSSEVLRWKLEVHGSLLKQVSNFFSLSNPITFRFKIGHLIKEIRERLDEIAVDRRNFHFMERVVDAQIENRMRESHSFVQESDVIGRNSDKDEIMKLLLSSNDHGDLSVITIVGLGGLGKTTLAKLVYNDHEVVQYFELRMWVCISEDFDLKKIIEKVLKSAMGRSYSDLDIDQLQTHLRNDVCVKKFLLVLDDVWNDDVKKWLELRKLLIGGARGSKIVVTTRNSRVASIMGTIPPYNLKGLSNDECLSIFIKCAFREGQEKRHPKLLEIGEEIVNKCGGIPLAVLTLGSLLYMKTEEQEWSYIRDNEMWRIEQKENDILPILRNFDFDIWKCKMHDLVHDLAQLVASTECLIVNLDTKTSIPEKVRHVSFYDTDLSSKAFPRWLLKAEKLRSFRLSYRVGTISKSFLETLIERFKCLRILGLSESDFEEVPSSIGSLKHLRYINLAYNNRIKALPNSICKLLNLQMLNLLGCDRLQGLPRDIRKLVSLENLYLTSQLMCLPEKGLQGLTSLQILQLFRCCYLTSLSEGMKYLTNLRTLRIIECPRLASLPSGLKYLTALEKLVIKDCPEFNFLESEDIQGLESLRSVVIGGLPKLEGLPQGLQQAIAALQYLCIEDCPSLRSLPQWLKHLTSLHGLSIVDCPNLLSLPEGLESLTTLQVLNIKGSPHLSRRCRKEAGEDWPSISHIQEIYVDSLKF